MKIGVTMFATDQAIAPAELARAAEERGFHSLYLPEHTHIPTSRKTPPPTGDAELAEEYRRTLDPFVALGAAAAVTSHLRLGTGVCLVAQRDPIVTAKAAATLDHISGGRLVFGIGYGWNREEMRSHGVAPRLRREIVREKMLAMERLWDQDAAEFGGEHVRFEPSWSWPKPKQRPRPPVLLGGAPGPTLFAHIAEYADGWMPIGGAGVNAALPALHRAVADAGRDPAKLMLVLLGTLPDPRKLEYHAAAGVVTEVALRLPASPSADVLRILDDYARLCAPYLAP
jgi:probable F420-dependent oxidoreductase